MNPINIQLIINKLRIERSFDDIKCNMTLYR